MSRRSLLNLPDQQFVTVLLRCLHIHDLVDGAVGITRGCVLQISLHVIEQGSVRLLERDAVTGLGPREKCLFRAGSAEEVHLRFLLVLITLDQPILL